ncbi:MAG: zinc ribbon domain-containing protein [Candidatus Poribacteria bacterium]
MTHELLIFIGIASVIHLAYGALPAKADESLTYCIVHGTTRVKPGDLPTGSQTAAIREHYVYLRAPSYRCENPSGWYSKHLLSGLVYCGKCGLAMVGCPTKSILLLRLSFIIYVKDSSRRKVIIVCAKRR